MAFSGNAKLGATSVPTARSAGPPRSSSQYQRLKTMMFVNQMAAPRPSRSVAVIPWTPFRMSTIRTATPAMVPNVMIEINTIVDRRAARERRSIRPGSRMITTISRTNSRIGNSHHP